MVQEAIRLAEALGLLDERVFFGDWASYEEWPNYLLEADVALSLHFDTIEARLAFRSRVLDYVWAGLPMVVMEGDVTGEMIAADGLGIVVDFQDVNGVTEAILTLLGEQRVARKEQFVAAQAGLTWEQAAQPLVEFFRTPHHAADRQLVLNPIKGHVTLNINRSRIDLQELRQQIAALEWYHTIDLGNGILTPGDYDHRPYLAHYGIPENLTGKTVLDIGAASGFFSFEMERRGARVTALDLPAWFAHDFGPCYQPDKTAKDGQRYLQDPIMLAKARLGSQIDKVEMTIYDISPETVGMYNMVFCGSLLIHLTDPVRALWQIQRVTREVAIIATVVDPDSTDGPRAQFVGHHHGDGWWIPNRAGLEAMVQSAGFKGWEWFSEFRLNYRDGRPGPYHGVIRAWNTDEKPDLPLLKPAFVTDVQSDDLTILEQTLTERESEIARLRELVAGYERGRLIRLMKWWRNLRRREGIDV